MAATAASRPAIATAVPERSRLVGRPRGPRGAGAPVLGRRAVGGPGRMPAVLVFMAVVSAASCDSCNGRGGSGGTSSGGSWLVGESALMLNINHDDLGEVGHYDLQLADDLYGIACRG